ncbi:MAG TPA: substrate-binding domain-containing protein [Planctomycetota bacterium]|nr:substrate-binding domain-containing protein [Planctomycetota bacterium]HRR81839.1 substrate-binding domain-containing protein [Planctomycetota bacterium]HRT97510.1 substrate-binding domain-containing protein [Planctomycetota bacterium]
MADPRRIAVLFDPDALDLRRREIVRGIARYAQAHCDWQVSLEPHGHLAAPEAFHGAIATGYWGRGPALESLKCPVVMVSRGNRDQPAPRAAENRAGGGRMAAGHLADAGCRAFAYLGVAKQVESRLEWAEFHKELARRGHKAHRMLVPPNYGKQVGRRAAALKQMAAWLGGLPRPAGLLAARVGLARAAADAAARLSLRVPDDLAIVAADDDPVLCELPPALSAIHYDYEELGWRAAQALDRLMRGEASPRRANTLIPPVLVPRLSTDRAHVGDPLVAKAVGYIDRRRTERFSREALDAAGRTCDRLGPRDVAHAMGVSLRTLESRFRAARGRTVAQEIARARLAHARLCLEEGLLPLPVVARESGFGSYAAMRRAFRVLAGTTPGAVRTEAALRRLGAPEAETYRKRPRRTARVRLPRQ